MAEAAAESPPFDPGDADAAYEKALRILKAAAQTRAGLGRRLSRAGYDDDTVAGVCARLVEVGYLDDRAYAESALSRRRRQGRGARLVASELRHKGIDPGVIQDLLGSVDETEELERATALAAQMLARRAAEEPRLRRERIMGTLARRGYSQGVARRAVLTAESA